MAYLNGEINNVNPFSRTEQVGIWIQNGGAITLDVPLGHVFKFLRVRTVGDINIRGIDGNAYLLIDAQPGEYHPVWGTEVLSSSTTATGIYWYGGV